MKSAPKHLQPVEAELFDKMKSEYAIEDSAGVALLTLACESQELIRHCRETIDAAGQLTAAGRAHPLYAVMRDARTSFLSCIKQLGLDLESAGNVGAPVGNMNGSKLKRVK